MVHRVRILFINCPTLDTDAAAHLILAQNTVQSVIQFEVHPFFIYSLRSQSASRSKRAERRFERAGKLHWLGPLWQRRLKAKEDRRVVAAFRKCISQRSWSAEVADVVNRFDAWVPNRGPDANSVDFLPCPTIVVTQTKLADGFMSFYDPDRKMGVISAGEWQSFFKPESALEYVLISVQRVVLQIRFGRLIRFHYATRGCIGDYNQNQADMRIGASLGFICETCRTQIRRVIDAAEYQQITDLLKNEWIGDKDSPSSVAFAVKKLYGHNVGRSKRGEPAYKWWLSHVIIPVACVVLGFALTWLVRG